MKTLQAIYYNSRQGSISGYSSQQLTPALSLSGNDMFTHGTLQFITLSNLKNELLGLSVGCETMLYIHVNSL